MKIHLIYSPGLLFLLCFLTPLPLSADPTPSPQSEIEIDRVVATVDGFPITLSDLEKRIGKGPLTYQAAKADPQVKAILEQLTQEALIKQEASKKKLSVDAEEIDQYIAAVAERNNLTKEEFEQAVKDEGKNFAEYRGQVEIEVLKSKLMSSLVKGGVSVSDSEIDSYLQAHPELKTKGARIKLRQIVLRVDPETSDQAKSKLEDIKNQVSSASDFAQAATRYSQGAEAQEGGLIGILNVRELSEEIKDAVQGIENKGVSDVIMTSDTAKLFYVEERFGSDEEEDEDEIEERSRNEARKILQEQKSEVKLGTFFTSELEKKHSIDIKL